MQISIRTVENKFDSEIPAERAEAEELIREIKGFSGIRILGRLYGVVTNNATKYDVRLAADIIMIEVLKIMTTAHAFAQTNNHELVDTVQRAHGQLINDAPYDYRDEAYNWFAKGFLQEDPMTGEMITKFYYGYSFGGSNIYCKQGDYTNCFENYKSIVTASFRTKKGLYLIVALDEIGKIKNEY
jgi:hypothetical protein